MIVGLTDGQLAKMSGDLPYWLDAKGDKTHVVVFAELCADTGSNAFIAYPRRAGCSRNVRTAAVAAGGTE